MTGQRLVAYCRPEDEHRVRRHLGATVTEVRTSDIPKPGQAIIVDEVILDEPPPFPTPLHLR